jgi:hypothetical protein
VRGMAGIQTEGQSTKPRHGNNNIPAGMFLVKPPFPRECSIP